MDINILNQGAQFALGGAIYKSIGALFGHSVFRIEDSHLSQEDKDDLKLVCQICAAIFGAAGTLVYGISLYRTSQALNIKWCKNNLTAYWGTVVAASIGSGLSQSENLREKQIVQALHVAGEIVTFAAIVGVFACANSSITDSRKSLWKFTRGMQVCYLLEKSYLAIPEAKRAPVVPDAQQQQQIDDRLQGFDARLRGVDARLMVAEAVRAAAPPRGGGGAVGAAGRAVGGEEVEKPPALREIPREEGIYVGRDKELKKVLGILRSDAEINNVLLKGPAGNGKTTMVHHIAQKIYAGEVPGLEGYRVFTVTPNELVAGATYQGEFQQRIKELFEFLESQENVLLFVDEIDQLFEGRRTAASTFLSYLAKGNVRVIGATATEASKDLNDDVAFNQRFIPVSISETSLNLRREILEKLAEKKRDEGFELPGDLSEKLVTLNHSKGRRSPRDDRALFEMVISTMVQEEERMSFEDALSEVIEGGALEKNPVSMPSFLSELTAETRDVVYLGRNDFVGHVLDILYSDDEANNVIFQGPAGSGKTQLARFLASQIRKRELEGFNDVKIYMTTASDMVAGGSFVGDPEKRVKDLFDFLEGAGEVILFIDEIHHLIGAGQAKGKTADLSGMFLTKLLNPNIRVIGATTPHEAQALDHNQPFKTRFTTLELSPMEGELRSQIVNGYMSRYEDLEFPEGFGARVAHHNQEMEKDSIREDKQLIARIAARMRRMHIDAEQAFGAVTAAIAPSEEDPA